MTVHGFKEELAYSHSQADAPWWEEVYRTAFTDMVSMVDLRDDGWHQKAGRDRAIVLSTGRTLWVDEKVRRDNYNDILFEVWSTYPKDMGEPYPPTDRATPGWACKPMDCDYLAYAVEATQRCYLLPFFTLRKVVQKYGPSLRRKAQARQDGYRWTRTENRSYNTICIAVPVADVPGLFHDAMTIEWGLPF